MATVYITKELKQRTNSVIKSMCKREINNDFPLYNASKQVEATHLYHLGCWGKEHVHLINVIPKDWLRNEKAVTITVRGTDEVGMETSLRQEFESKNSVFYGRPSTDYWNRSDSSLLLEDIRAMPEDTPGRAEILERWSNEMMVRQIEARWNKISMDIAEFLDKCKSLNEALKLFPTLRMYIDSEDLERVDRKVERASQRKKLVEEVDVEGITAAAIAAKLSASV
jgi:hypothetical protein